MKAPVNRRLLQASIACTALSFAIHIPATAQAVDYSTTQVRSITVSGVGKLYVVPDMATVRFGVVTVNDDPKVARSLNAEAASAAMNVIRDSGIEDRKIRLDALRLEPNRVYDEATRRYIEKGFRAVRDVSVKLEDLDLLPELIADVVESGANRIQGVLYGLIDRREIELRALKLAMHDAQNRAEVMVTTIGAELGDVLRISEQGISVPEPILRLEKAAGLNEMATSAAPDAFASGEIEITANVTLVFAIK